MHIIMLVLVIQVSFLATCVPSAHATPHETTRMRTTRNAAEVDESSSIFRAAIATQLEHLDHLVSPQDSKQKDGNVPSMPVVATVAANHKEKTTTTTHGGQDARGDGGDTSADDEPFCRGMPMTMFMDGFHWSLWWRSHNTTTTATTTTTTAKPPHCLVYFVSSWELSDEGKFKGAMVFSFLMGLLMEGLSAMRAAVSRQGEKHHHHTSSNTNRQRRLHHFLMTFIYAIQALLGYLLMFLAMAYSMELVLSTILGLVVGNLCLIRYEYPKASSRRVDYVPPPPSTPTTTAATQPSNNSNCPEREPLLPSSSNPVTEI
jgi:hypothetical protein